MTTRTCDANASGHALLSGQLECVLHLVQPRPQRYRLLGLISLPLCHLLARFEIKSGNGVCAAELERWQPLVVPQDSLGVLGPAMIDIVQRLSGLKLCPEAQAPHALESRSCLLFCLALCHALCPRWQRAKGRHQTRAWCRGTAPP